jgi:signal transduction histidine kinase
MKKHSESTLVVLSFKKDQKIVQLNYTDNGVGATFKKQKIRNGLQNVENRIHAIKGTITFDTETGKGFKVNILFPI